MKYVTIHGIPVPAVGLGTWQLKGEICIAAVEHALSIGYRHIDTAQVYDNEREVGRALRTGRVDRDEIFLTTKIAPANFARNNIITSTHQSLKILGTEYVDLLLLHWPSRAIALEETLGALLELKQACQVRHIGLSNFSASEVERASRYAPIFCNQVEYHPYLAQPELLAQAREMDYMLTAYCPLALGKVLQEDHLLAIGKAHGKSIAQVALRWLIQQDNVIAIPKAGSAEHRCDNLAIFDFALSETEMQHIHAINRRKRVVIAEMLGWEH